MRGSRGIRGRSSMDRKSAKPTATVAALGPGSGPPSDPRTSHRRCVVMTVTYPRRVRCRDPPYGSAKTYIWLAAPGLNSGVIRTVAPGDERRAGAHGDVLLAVHGERHRITAHRRAEIDAPQHLAGAVVECLEVAVRRRRRTPARRRSRPATACRPAARTSRWSCRSPPRSRRRCRPCPCPAGTAPCC